MPTPDLIVIRCTAHQNDLDSGGGHCCSHYHTELLVSKLKLGILWDEYSLVGDIVVCFFHSAINSVNSHLINSLL